jgi:hypothetical protein
VKRLTKEEENRRMLAAVLGIAEEEAAERLGATLLITSATDVASVRLARQVQAMAKRTVNATLDPASDCLVEVVVGAAKPQRQGIAHVWVGSFSEGIKISTTPFETMPSSEHAIFRLIAACYACGMAIRIALGRELPLPGHDSIVISPRALLGNDVALLDLPCEIRQAVLAGAGAIGNGFLYGLQHFDVRGLLHIVDPKHVHDGILNRCIWFESTDIGWLKSEAMVQRAQAAFPHLKLVSQPSTLKDFTIAEGAPALERLISTVDSRRARRGLQNEIPHEVFDASTTDIKEVVLHFNEQPSELACMSCIYHQEEGELAHEAHVAEALGVSREDVKQGFVSADAALKICLWATDLAPQALVGKAYDTLFKARCAAGKLRTAEDRQVLAPFCNVSMLAGAMLALEFVRRVNTGTIAAPYNYWRLSPWHNPVLALRASRMPIPACEFCGEAVNREVAQELWGA